MDATNARSTSLLVNEVYLSIQGESTWAGLPCVFVRLTGCPLRCTYCDTEYAFAGGQRLPLEELLRRIRSYGCRLVEVTGGEPLAQRGTVELLQLLLDEHFDVLLETSGAFSIREVPRGVCKIMDLKCPSSGECERNEWGNIELLAPHDEVKFVIADRGDYDWARDICARYGLARRCRAVLFSPVFGALEPRTLAEWLLADQPPGARLQLQLHKYIWSPEQRGV